VKLDMTGKNKKVAAAAAEEYNVIGQPNFIYLSPDGKIMERWSGGYETEELIDALSRLR
jgi:cytochrome oxidase Cu insertion factor (SCO1/SenC/PrrC family)